MLRAKVKASYFESKNNARPARTSQCQSQDPDHFEAKGKVHNNCNNKSCTMTTLPSGGLEVPYLENKNIPKINTCKTFNI